MRLNEDFNKFDGFQMSLKWRLGRAIFACLEDAGLKPQLVDKLCDDILFAVTDLLDGGDEPIVSEKEGAYPVLGFVLEQKPEEVIVVPDGGTSWMHEYVLGTGEFLRNEKLGKES